MACRGVYYAITCNEAEQLLHLVGNDDALAEMEETLATESRETQGFLAGVDKAWDAMHRCLGNGLLADIGKGSTPLSRFVLGGRNLYQGTDYIICYLPSEQVREVAEASAKISKEWMRERYFGLDPKQYDGPWNEQDWEYTWSYFEEARKLFEKASAQDAP